MSGRASEPPSDREALAGASPERARTRPDGWGRALFLLPLGLALALLGWSWSRVQGYEIADAVEYLERAWAFSRGEPMIDNKSIRAVGFSALLLPFFLLQRWLSGGDATWIPHAARALQIVFALALVAIAARLAARLMLQRGAAIESAHAPRQACLAALATGILLATNPVLLRWGVCPVSGLASALCLLVACERLLLEPAVGRPPGVARAWPGFWPGWSAGLALGASFCLAYSVLPLVAALALTALWLTRRRRGLFWGFALALSTMLLLQCLADQLYYGRFGLSVQHYLHENFGTNAALLLFQSGRALGWQALIDAGRSLYETSAHVLPVDRDYQQQVLEGAQVIRALKPRHWYLTHLPQAFGWGSLCLIALGLGTAWRERLSAAGWLFWLCAVVALATSLKGSKDFRLWLPILAPLAVLGGLGFAGLCAPRQGGLPGGAFIGALALTAGALQGVLEHARSEAASFAAYARAMDWLNRHTHLELERAALTGSALEQPVAKVASAFHWAVFLREKPWLELQKLPRHLGYWAQYTEQEKALDLEALEQLDFVIAHQSELTSKPDLFAAIAGRFAVAAAFYDRTRERAGVGPVLVLERRTGASEECLLFEFQPGRAAEGAPRAAFRGALGARLELLDFEYRALPGDGWGWIRYRWSGGGFGARDWTFVDRLTTARGGFAWQNNHAPAYGQCPTSRWGDQALLEEGFLVVPEQDPFQPGAPGAPRRFLGGDFLAGDLVPAQLWFEIADFAAQAPAERRLDPIDPASGQALSELLLPDGPASEAGLGLSGDGYTRAGNLWLKVAPAAREPAREPAGAPPLEAARAPG